MRPLADTVYPHDGLRFSEEIGCFGVLTHPPDDEVRAFYNQIGFGTLPFDPRPGMVLRIVDLKRSGFWCFAPAKAATY